MARVEIAEFGRHRDVYVDTNISVDPKTLREFPLCCNIEYIAHPQSAPGVQKYRWRATMFGDQSPEDTRGQFEDVFNTLEACREWHDVDTMPFPNPASKAVWNCMQRNSPAAHTQLDRMDSWWTTEIRQAWQRYESNRIPGPITSAIEQLCFEHRTIHHRVRRRAMLQFAIRLFRDGHTPCAIKYAKEHLFV